MIDGGIGGGGRRRQAARFDDGGTAFADLRNEGVCIPIGIVDLVFQGNTAGGSEAVVRIHGRAVVAPDHHLLDITDRDTGFARQLAERAVVVETQHGGEVLCRQIRRRLHRDVGIGIGRVADHQNFDVTRGNGIQGLALHGEDLGVFQQQILAFHARSARTGADQQSDVDVFECDHRIIGTDHAGQQRERAVFQFHHHALERGLGFFHR